MDDNTEVQETNWLDVPVVSLHVDLVWTDLEDFSEHIESHFKRALEAMQVSTLRGFYTHDPLLGNVDGYLPMWDDDDIEYYESPTPVAASAEDARPGRYLRVTPIRLRTHANYLVDEWTKDPDQPYSPATIRFSLMATRYRRDRLKIVLYERTTQGGRTYAERLLGWLKERWGEDGVKDLTESAPPITAMPMRGKLGRPRDPWNRKAIDRLLAGDDPEQVRKEWRAEFETEIKMNLDQTSDGEEKTWQRRVWEPYQAKRAK